MGNKTATSLWSQPKTPLQETKPIHRESTSEKKSRRSVKTDSVQREAETRTLAAVQKAETH